jgi:hypothetical protein
MKHTSSHTTATAVIERAAAGARNNINRRLLQPNVTMAASRWPLHVCCGAGWQRRAVMLAQDGGSSDRVVAQPVVAGTVWGAHPRSQVDRSQPVWPLRAAGRGVVMVGWCFHVSPHSQQLQALGRGLVEPCHVLRASPRVRTGPRVSEKTIG